MNSTKSNIYKTTLLLGSFFTAFTAHAAISGDDWLFENFTVFTDEGNRGYHAAYSKSILSLETSSYDLSIEESTIPNLDSGTNILGAWNSEWGYERFLETGSGIEETRDYSTNINENFMISFQDFELTESENLLLPFSFGYRDDDAPNLESDVYGDYFMVQINAAKPDAYDLNNLSIPIIEAFNLSFSEGEIELEYTLNSNDSSDVGTTESGIPWLLDDDKNVLVGESGDYTVFHYHTNSGILAGLQENTFEGDTDIQLNFALNLADSATISDMEGDWALYELEIEWGENWGPDYGYLLTHLEIDSSGNINFYSRGSAFDNPEDLDDKGSVTSTISEGNKLVIDGDLVLNIGENKDILLGTLEEIDDSSLYSVLIMLKVDHSLSAIEKFSPSSRMFYDSQSSAWGDSDYLGVFYAGEFPWIYSEQNGWNYWTGEGGGAFWSWDTSLGWLWNVNVGTPWVYSDDLQAWIYLHPTTTYPNRMYYNYTLSDWFYELS